MTTSDKGATQQLHVMVLVQGGELPHAPGPTGYSGYIRYIRSSSIILQRKGYRVSFGTLRDRGPLHPVMEELGCSTFSLDCRNSRDYPRAAFRLKRLTQQLGVDVVHMHESIQGAVGGVSGVLGGSGARVYHRHHTVGKSPQTIFSKVAARTADVVMAVSEAAARHSKEDDHVASDRLCVAYNGVDELREIPGAETDELRRSLGISSSSRVVLLVGHLRPEKGYATLVEALEVVKRSIDEVELVIVGAGPEETTLREAVGKTNGVAAHFVGHQADVAPWYALADVVAIPSYTESFGLVAIEAMSASKPVVASDIEGLSEVIEDRSSGYLVPARDPLALSNGIVEILKSKALSQKLAAGAYQRFQTRFTVETMVDSWIACYSRALQISRPPKWPTR